jgi:hypothetical protein
MHFRPFLRCGVAGAAVFLTACAGPSRSYRTGLNSMIAASNFAGAQAEIEGLKETEYGRKNAVLYYLDLGMVQHDAGLYKDSDASFAAAEDRMEELFTKSLHRAAGTFLLNDNTTEYAGEVFERALLNAFRALNYVFLGSQDEALVEARKVTAYLARFNDFMQGRSGYRDSAFAQYLSGMLFEQNGDGDDARISYEAASAAYKWYGSDYGTPEPHFAVPSYADLDRQDLGEVVLLHYNGKAPMKVSRTFQVAWNEAMLAVNQSGEEEAGAERFRNALNAGVLGSAITVSYPEYVQDPYNIAASRVNAGGFSADTQLMEDVSAIARGALRDRNAAIRTRAIARAAIKYVLAKAASDEVQKRAGDGFGLLARIVTNATAAATETADTRGWTTVPAQIRMARVALPPGKHDVTITFTGRNGEPEGSAVFKDVEVVRGRRTYLHYRTAA